MKGILCGADHGHVDQGQHCMVSFGVLCEEADTAGNFFPASDMADTEVILFLSACFV